MTAANDFGGPVSAALESDLRTWVRRKQIVVWLDLDDHYSGFVDRLVAAREGGALPYTVRAFRGSYLELMIALEGLAGGVEKTPLLIHLPGFNEESVSHTPLYELYKAGVRYRKAVDTLITEAAAGRVPPDQIDAFLAQPDLSLDAADAWLRSLLTAGDAGFPAQLRAIPPAALLDDLLTGGPVAGRIGRPKDETALWDRWAASTGLPAAWREVALPPHRVSAEDMAFAAASWSLCVEYVHDLKRPPLSPLLAPARDLPRGVIESCQKLAAHLRERHSDFYRRTADETEALLADEVEVAQADDLGEIDTFRFEEEKVLKAALGALASGNWRAAAQWTTLRLDGQSSASSFWLRDDPARKSAWQLVHAAVRLDEALEEAGNRLAASGSLEAALETYVQHGAVVDQSHRHLEQWRESLLYPQVPEFELLRTCLDRMRRRWRQWADRWARDFNAICRQHGFLPSPSYQQRTLFDDVVRPLTQQPGATAYFLVDAFRYEMAEELHHNLLGAAATTVQLTARFAELPTVTEVGMNVLAPVSANGRLTPAISTLQGGSVLGFSTGEFRVADPESRKRAMHDRVGGATCPWLTLEEVTARDTASLKRTIAQARLVIVHSREIDRAGENELGPALFDNVMHKLRAAWTLLRDAGVRRFVFTSDHGFLLLDESADSVQTHGRRIDPSRRHIFSPAPADHAGEVRVALADLGYVGQEGYLMFPETTAVFDTGRRSMRFVHGGNSLQERLIPVLTVVHRTPAGSSLLQYDIVAASREGVAGMHCLHIKVDVTAQRALDFNSPKEVELGLRTPNSSGVQVELCQIRGQARIVGGAILATVSEEFELFFRLTGNADARVQVELYNPSAGANITPCVPDARFAVTPTRTPTEPPAAPDPAASAEPDSWLDRLPEAGVRQLFAHLAQYGVVTEKEAATMFGNQRALRRFAVHFEEYAQQAPFDVRIDVVAGVKRYVRQGSNP